LIVILTGQTNLEKGDIAALSYSPDGSTYHVCPGRCNWDPNFGSKGSVILLFERAMVVSYRLSIVTIALSSTIQPQFAVEYEQKLQ